MNVSINEIELFILVFARTAAIIALFPIFGSSSIPIQAKIGISVFIAVLIYPLFQDQQLKVPIQVLPFLLLLAKEILIGLVLGFVASLLFAGIQIAGQLVGMQMGFAIVNAIDPQTQQNVSVIAHFKTLLATMVFLSINGHLFLLSGIKKSYENIPLFNSVGTVSILQEIMRIGGGIFVTGVKIGAPVIVALLLTSVALGIVAKVFPQMNVFFVGLPLKIGMGIMVLAISIPLFCFAFQHLYSQFQNDFALVLRLLQ